MKRIDKENIEEVVKRIQSGQTVAIPTDTVYGLAVCAQDESLYLKLQKVKGRPKDKPFPLMVSNKKQIEMLCELTPLQEHLVDHFMPGAITFIFTRKISSFPFLNEQKTLGIRMADDPWVQAIIEETGPLWLPSANLSGYPTALNSDMVIEQLDGRIDAVVLGSTHGKVSSSVFDITQTPVKQLRQGQISLESLEKECMIYLENQ